MQIYINEKASDKTLVRERSRFSSSS